MNNEPVELSYFSDAIIRRWYLPLGLALIGALIGLQLRPEAGPALYEAESKLLIRPVTDSVFDSNIRIDQIINEDTEAQLAASELVAIDALDLLGTSAPDDLTLTTIEENLTVKVRTDSQIVVIRFQHEDPDTAGAVTDAIASAYLSRRSSTALAEKDRQASQLATQISELTRDLTTANVTIATGEAEQQSRRSLEQRIARLEEIVAIAALQGEPSEAVGDPIGNLTAELAALDTTVDPVAMAAAETSSGLITGQIANLRDELISLLTIEIDGGESIQSAGQGEPVLPPNGLVQPGIGGLVGLLLGIVLAVFVDRSVTARSTSAAVALGTEEPNLFVVNSARPETIESQSHGRTTPGHPPTPIHVHPSPAPSWGASTTATAEPIARATPTHVAEPALQAVELDEPQPIFDAENEPAIVETTPLSGPVDAGENDDDVALTAAPEPVAAEPSPAQPSASGNTVVSLADIAKIPRSATQPIVVTAPRSDAALALRRVGRIIQNDAAGLTTPSILVTSAREHEGKSTVAMNLAAALRQDGLSVLLITDAHAETTVPGVHVLPPGMQLGPELEFPETDRLIELLHEARDLVDVVLIDGPPTLTNTEAARIAAVTDRAIMVAVSSKTSASDVSTSKEMLENSGTTVLGLVTTSRPSWLVRRIAGPGDSTT